MKKMIKTIKNLSSVDIVLLVALGLYMSILIPNVLKLIGLT